MSAEPAAGGAQYAANVPRFYLYRFFINFQFWIPIFVLFLIEDRGLTLAQIALLETVFSITSLSAEVPTGAVADRFGRRTSMLLGSLVLAGAIVFYGLSPSFGWLAGAYFVWAIARTLESGADSAFVYDSLSAVGRESEFAQIIGRAQAFWLAGALTASLIGAPLAALIGLQPVILLGSVSTLAAAAVAFTFIEPPRTGGEERLRYFETMKEAARFTLRTPQILLTAGLFAIFLGLGFTVYTFFQPLLRENDVPVAAFALFTSPPQLVALLGSLLAYRVAAQLKERNFFIIAALGISLTIVFIGLAPGLMAFALFPIFRLFTSMFNPIALFYINTRTPQRIRATVVSVTSMAEGLFLAALGPPIGYLADSTSLETAFIVVGVTVAALGGVNLIFWLAADRSGAPPELDLAIEPAPLTGAPKIAEIYHLLPRSDLAELASGEPFLPQRFAEDGFVHCTGDLETLLQVADDYFSELDEDLFALAIQVDELTSPLRWEDAAPLPGGGEHTTSGRKFPHIYGPVNRQAISGAAIVPRARGRYVRPAEFASLESLLEGRRAR